MASKTLALLTLALAGSLLTVVYAQNLASPTKMIGDFTLKDIAGKPISLSQFQDKKAVVVVFLGTECPVNNFFLPRLAELHKEFADQGVQILGINANRQDTPDKIAANAKKFEIPFPVLRDENNVIADRFGA